MNFINILIIIYYLWSSYKFLLVITFGYLIYQLVILFLSITLIISICLFISTNEYIYLWLPLIPYCIYLKINTFISKKLIKK